MEVATFPDISIGVDKNTDTSVVQRKIKSLPTRGRRDQPSSIPPPSSTAPANLDPNWEERLEEQVASGLPPEFRFVTIQPPVSSVEVVDNIPYELSWTEEEIQGFADTLSEPLPNEREHMGRGRGRRTNRNNRG
jgi:hypothetical protein